MPPGRTSGSPCGSPGGAAGRLKPINLSPQEAPRMHPMSFFRPRRLPRAILDTSWGQSGAKLGPKSETKGLGSDLGATNEPPEGLGTFRNHGFHSGKPSFWRKRAFQQQPRKRTPTCLPLGEPRGAPGRFTPINSSPQEVPRSRTMVFVRPQPFTKTDFPT